MKVALTSKTPLLDMPICDGVEAAKRVRAAEMQKKLTNTLPSTFLCFLAHELRPKSDHVDSVIALSADCQESTKELCLSAGMNGFLTKPMRPGKLSSSTAGNEALTLSVPGDLPSLLRTYSSMEMSASASL